MLQNAYFLEKIGADTAENDQHFAEILPKIGNYPTGPLPYGSPQQEVRKSVWTSEGGVHLFPVPFVTRPFGERTVHPRSMLAIPFLPTKIWHYSARVRGPCKTRGILPLINFTDRLRVTIRHVWSILLTAFVSKSSRAFESSKSKKATHYTSCSSSVGFRREIALTGRVYTAW